MVKVKVCGVRDEVGARACVRAGVDFAGLNFVRESRRRVSPDRARLLLPLLEGTIAVALFRDEDPAIVEAITTELGIDWVQLHGAESLAGFESLLQKKRIVRAFPYGAFDPADLSRWTERGAVPLFDGPRPGRGQAFAWHRLDCPVWFFIAGGLTPHNVIQAISATGASAVDTASGVERHGRIDPDLVDAFVRRARGLEESAR